MLAIRLTSTHKKERDKAGPQRMMGQRRHPLDCSSSHLILHSLTAVGYSTRIKTGLLQDIVIVFTRGYLTEGLFLSHKHLAEK